MADNQFNGLVKNSAHMEHTSTKIDFACVCRLQSEKKKSKIASKDTRFFS